MDKLVSISAVVPSIIKTDEEFTLKIRLVGEPHHIPNANSFHRKAGSLGGPYNYCMPRDIKFLYDTLLDWQGSLEIGGSGSLSGSEKIDFACGADAGTDRALIEIPGYNLSKPGFHFITVTDPVTGITGKANPVYVTDSEPALRLFWGDPHWQTYFTDGVRSPEELFEFARDEAFLDFGALSDHMEGLTKRQWDYFQLVTNDFNEPGRFATMVGQEWTHHHQGTGAPGHRNIYVRGDKAPLLSSRDPECDTLEKLWEKLDGLEAIAIPHHTANVVMGCKWELGWNEKYEKAVEICSVWGSSEKPESEGNTMPIRSLKGEMPGRHVIDALRKGFRFGFVGGGDIHDGRPGLNLHHKSYPQKQPPPSYPGGYTGVWVSSLEREEVFDAIAEHRTCATTQARIFLQVTPAGTSDKPTLDIRVAASDGIASATLVYADREDELSINADDNRILEATPAITPLGEDEFVYLRIVTSDGSLGWASPVWQDDWK